MSKTEKKQFQKKKIVVHPPKIWSWYDQPMAHRFQGTLGSEAHLGDVDVLGIVDIRVYICNYLCDHMRIQMHMDICIYILYIMCVCAQIININIYIYMYIMYMCVYMCGEYAQGCSRYYMIFEYVSFFWHISERKHKIPQPVSATMVMASVAKAQLLSPNALHDLNLPELR